MRRFIRYRPSPAMVIALIALFVALSGTATALSGANIIGKNDFKKGAVNKRAIGADAVGKSEAREDNDEGGGFTGAQINEDELGTVPSASGLRLWGVVNSNGAFERGAGVTSTSRTAAGAYHVVFNQDVTDCGYLATLGRIGAQVAQAGEIGTGSLPGNVNGVWVRTRDSAGALSDRSFHIAIVC